MQQLIPVPNFLPAMVERGWLGNKSGQGFYKRMHTDGGQEFYELVPRTLDYQPARRLQTPALLQARSVEDMRQRVQGLAYADDRAGRFAWQVLGTTLLYAAGLLPEIADDIDSDSPTLAVEQQLLGRCKQAMLLGAGTAVQRFRSRSCSTSHACGVETSLGRSSV